MAEQITSNKSKYICDECKNENIIPEGTGVGDVIECEFCGIEFEVTAIDDEGNYTLSIIEEEK